MEKFEIKINRITHVDNKVITTFDIIANGVKVGEAEKEWLGLIQEMVLFTTNVISETMYKHNII